MASTQIPRPHFPSPTMTNPNDNSELFEIFQNQVDLDQDQDDDEDQEDETSEENEPDEHPNQKNQTEQDPETGSTSDASSEPARNTSDSTQPKSERPTSSGDQPQRNDDAPSSHEPDPSPQQSPPSSTVAQEEGNHPDTETGSYIKDMEDEKELEGKIILSRGASVFLLILAIIAMIGAYFIGLQTGSNQQIVDSKTAATSEDSEGEQNPSNNQSGNAQGTVESTTDNQSSDQETSDREDNSSGIVPGKTYYTIGLIAYQASQNNVNKYVSTVQRSLREDAKLRYVSSVQNPAGNRQIWVVVGYFKDRETAKQKLTEIEDNLNQTDYQNDFTKDILEISSDQAESIAGS